MGLLLGGHRLLQGSMSPTGGTFTGAVLFANGSVSAPSIALASSSDTGFYYSGYAGGMFFASSGAVSSLFGTQGSGVGGISTTMYQVKRSGATLTGNDNAATYIIQLHPITGAVLHKTVPLAFNNGGTGLNGSNDASLYWGAASLLVVGTGAASGNGDLLVNAMRLIDGITAPSATSGQAKIYVDTADGDLKVIFGDGTIKTIATDT